MQHTMHIPRCVRCRCIFIRLVLFAMLTFSAVMWCYLYISNSHRNEHTRSKGISLHVIVMVYNRALSLKRLLDSLNKAHYDGDNVTLDVWIDRNKHGAIVAETYICAKSYSFLHGDYHIFNQTHHAGIYGQWIRTWQPSEGSSEIGVLLEDDLTVSPYFYKWLKVMHAKYDTKDYINGFSLQGISITHGINSKEKYLDVNKRHRLFLYPILGTWGFSPKVKNWLQFVSWYNTISLNSSFQPLVEGILPTEWYKVFLQQGKEDTMWEMWHIYHAWINNELTLYSNFPGHQGLAINWKEPGLHYSGNNGNMRPDPLLLEWKSEYEDLPDTPLVVDVNGIEKASAI